MWVWVGSRAIEYGPWQIQFRKQQSINYELIMGNYGYDVMRNVGSSPLANVNICRTPFDAHDEGKKRRHGDAVPNIGYARLTTPISLPRWRAGGVSAVSNTVGPPGGDGICLGRHPIGYLCRCSSAPTTAPILTSTGLNA